VLLHALGESAADWTAVAAELAADRHVYALDLRGHGDSDRTNDYSFESMRDDVCGFMDALGLGKVDLVGHSLGGIVAYLVAAHRRDLVGRLVLEEVPPPLPVEPPRGRPVRPDEPFSYDWAAVEAVYAQRDRPDPAWLAALGEIVAPTLLVCGGSTSPLPQDQFGQLADQVSDCLMVTIPAGHLVHASRPADFTAAVVEFLER
jgi:pimeloyl-ACP methyl ester carboxylesterase